MLSKLMASRPRKAPTVASSAPWFGRHLRKRTAPELRGYEFSDKRKLKKFMYNENGEDVRLINPGVNWKVLSELRATYKEGYEEAVGEIFDKHMSTMLATSRPSTQQMLDIHPQAVRSTRLRTSFERKPAKDVPNKAHAGSQGLHTSANEGVPMETTATSRATRSKRSKGHQNQKADDLPTEFEVAISDLHPIVDVTNTGRRQSTQSHAKKDSVLHPIVDLTNTPYQKTTRSHTRKDSVPMGKSDDQNTEPGLSMSPPTTEKEVPISTNREKRNSQGEEPREGAKLHLPQPQPTKRVTRARKQKCNSSRKSEEMHAAETVVSDGAESVRSQSEASISEGLPSTAVKRSVRARTRRQKVQLGSEYTADTSDVRAETVPSAPSTTRVTRLRARAGKAPTADGSILDWDSSLADTASHRTTRSRTRRAVPEPEVIMPVHSCSSRMSDGVEIITDVRNGNTKTSSEVDHTKTNSEADCNNETPKNNCGVSDHTLAEQSPQVPDQPGIQKLPVLDSTSSDMKPSEPPMDKIGSQEPQPHPEPIEAAGVKDLKSPCHILSAVSSSSDVTTDCSYAADTEDECVPSKRPRVSKRLPLKLKKKRKRKRKASTTTKQRKVESESEAKTLDGADSDDRKRTGEQPITGDLTETGRVEAEAPANLAESLYESCIEDVETPNCTSACPSGSDELSSQLKVFTKASRIPTPIKSTGSNSVPTPQTCTKSTGSNSVPTPQTCTKSRPALSPTISVHECTPTLPSTPQTYIKSMPALPSTPQTYVKSRPAVSPTIPAPQMSTCTKSKPALSPTVTVPQRGTCTKSKPALSPAVTVPQIGTCTKSRPALSPTSVPYLTGTPKTIKMLQEEHCTQNRSNLFSFSELMASKGRTPQSPRIVTTVTKTCKSPAKPSSIPVPITKAPLCGTKRLRSVSLEKLPLAKRPSKSSTPDSTQVESTTSSSDGAESGGSSPDSVGGGMDSQEFLPTPATPSMPTLPIPATPSQLRETESAESFTSSSGSSSEKTDQSDATPYSVVGGVSRNAHITPSQLRQPCLPSRGMSTSTETGNLKNNRTVTKTNLSLWSILEKGDGSKLTFHAPFDLPVSHTPPRKLDTFEERRMKRVEKAQQKIEEVERRKRELEVKKQRELQDKIRRREERAKRVAENQAMKLQEEEERKRRAQGQWVHEEQIKKIAQKKAKEMEERNRKHKERMQAAEVRRRQEDELKKRHIQQIQEDRRMAEELARKRLEQEEEEKRQRRQEKLKLERERQLQREHEAEMRRLQEEEDRQRAEKQQRRQEELRKMQDQARKDEEKRKFEKLLTGSGSKFMKPPAPLPSQPASNTKKFIQQWKQLKTQAGDFFSTVTKSKPPQGQQISPPQEECSALNSTFTKDTSSELTTNDAATGAPVTQSSATPVHNSKIGKKHTPILSYQMTPIQDDPLYDNYDIGNLNSEDSTDDDECPRKQIPTWAQPHFLNTWIQSQEEEVRRNMIDITRLFPPEELLKEPDLAKIFRKKRKRFFDRTSSAQWSSPMLKKSREECL